MLEKEDREEIAHLVKAVIDSDVTPMFAQQKTDIMQEVSVLIESKFMPQFKVLAEGQQAIMEKLVPTSRVDNLEEEVMLLKIKYRQMNEDIQQLKKAQ